MEVDGESFSLEILDTAGSNEFTAMRELYVSRGQGFAIVYSVVNSVTFRDAELICEEIIMKKETANIVLVGNKIDLTEQRIVSTEEGRCSANRFGCPFLEVSAKVRLHLDDIFLTLVRNAQSSLKNPKQKKASECQLL
eukprot:TRINITY_DN1400_c0_g1_i3.p1 TRINITY_DN1400_c0_g1~~TRINITY_DN1400_c0_g1_i3.p1  ORF type:complete len:138 (+),score=13.39 TRINITY_DN1400_c0_g1_i3:186-599(+)